MRKFVLLLLLLLCVASSAFADCKVCRVAASGDLATAACFDARSDELGAQGCSVVGVRTPSGVVLKCSYSGTFCMSIEVYP